MLEDCEMDGRELEVWWEIQLQCFIVSWESEGGVVGLGVRGGEKKIFCIEGGIGIGEERCYGGKESGGGVVG